MEQGFHSTTNDCFSLAAYYRIGHDKDVGAVVAMASVLACSGQWRQVTSCYDC